MTELDKKARSAPRYEAAKSALKQGVSILVQEQPSQRVNGECSPKELRTENLILSVELNALVALLVDKEVITIPEYASYLADFAENQVAQYEDRLSKILGGRKVKLA